MRNLNALSGIGLIRKAEILSFSAAILAVLMIPIAYGGRRNAGILLLLLLTVAALAIAALVVELVGVSRAAKDASAFQTAKSAIIAGLVVAVIGALVPDENPLDLILELVSDACSLCATVYIMKGLISMARNYSRKDVAAAGQGLLRLLLITGVAAMGAEILIWSASSKPDSLFYLLFFCAVALVIGIIQFVLFMRYTKTIMDLIIQGNTKDWAAEGAQMPQRNYEWEQRL
ncbi:MAG: hypothetical protein J5789_01675 [Oscillospiraceae bacterium]|nr:hypothetical protein [Oscillospiraceae bacterium]